MRLISTCLLILSCMASIHAASVWVEGEDANSSTCKAHPWWYDKVKTEVLSGGAWHSNWNDSPGIATYNVEMPETGSYTLWVRANPLAAKLSWRVDGGDWTLIDWEQGKRGNMNIAADNKADMRFIQWTKAGTVNLQAGVRKIAFQYHSDNNNHGAIDCFALTTDRWVPSGATKPGEQAGAGEGEPAGPDMAIWLEGENAKTDAKPHSWYNSVKHDVLSGGAWLNHFDDGRGATASWTFEVIEADSYAFWIRSNPLRSRLQWSLDGGTPTTIDHKDGSRGNMNIAADNKPDLRFIQWNKLGAVDLTPGKHTLTITIGGEGTPSNHGAIDAICFSRIAGWVPSGAKKPMQPGSTSVSPDTWYPVVADDDVFDKESVIDMSALVPAPAGSFGRVILDGPDLAFKKTGKRAVFWGVGSNQASRTTDAAMQQSAKFYRKHGINLVRQHTVMGAVGLLDKNGNFDAAKLDAYDKWFATLKEEGIYSTWSMVYPHHGNFIRDWELTNEAHHQELLAKSGKRDGAIQSNDYINLDRHIQDIVLQYFTKLLDHTNPYTGMKYKDDPALVVVEMQNESNVFFHTFNHFAGGKEMPAFTAVMQRRWFEWAKAKYGNADAAKAAWGGFKGGDNWSQGRLAMHGVWEFEKTSEKDDPKHLRRIGDFINFYTDVQHEYYQRRYQDLRDCGYDGLIVTTAWKGVGASSMANLYCDSVGDVIDRHNYSGGGDGGHRITEGKVNSTTHLDQPGRGLFAIAQEANINKPYAISEWSYTPPAAYKAEAAPLMAFYGMGLQGWDMSYHFATAAGRIGDGWPGLGKYVSNTPHYMGQFPALAFAVYKGHIKTGDVVAHRAVNDAMLYAGWDVLGSSIGGGSHDYKDFSSNVATPPEVFAIGRIGNSFDGAAGSEADLAPYWNKRDKRLTSTTGELVWDYDDKLVEVRAEKTQAIIGFAEGKTIDLPGVAVSKIQTPFISLIFTPLDDQPLTASKRILITAMAREKQTGAEFNADWTRLLSVGGPPLLMEPVQAAISLKGGKPSAVQVLDIYGVPTERQVEVAADGSFTIDGTQQSYYYLITR